MVEPFFRDDRVTVYAEDALAVLGDLPANSIDAVCTDPPYAISLMRTSWDTFRSAAHFQEWCTQWGEQCFRAIKPGGHVVAFGGTRTWHRLTSGLEDAGFEIRDSLAWLYGSGFPKAVNLTDDTGDRTGWATALKPGFEPIVLARKPVERTVASNAAAYGTGALHVDACRLPTTDSLGGGSNAKGRVMSTDGWTRPWMADAVAAAASASRSRASTARSEALGRWPANVVLDDQQADILDQQAPGASRFYYAAKPGTAERPRVDGVSHPSVKPLALMRWLIRLVTPAGGVVLDPFAGSGATVEACLLESRCCIAIERDLSFLPLIEHRLTRQADLLRTESDSA